MTNRFEYTDTDGDGLLLMPWSAGGPGPAVGLIAVPREGKSAGVFIPLDRVEEVIAGMRDMARQAAYTVAYRQPARFPGDSAAMRAAALSCVRPEKHEESPVLAPAERQFLTFALNLAADQMADRGDEFTDEDDAALTRLRQLAEGGEQ